MKRRLPFFLFLLNQYSISELLRLATNLLKRHRPKSSDKYLFRTLRSFATYHSSGLEVQRLGECNVVKMKDISVILRRDSSDFLVFDQIFIAEELKPIVDLIRENRILIESILDCGANIGLTSLYLSRHFPGASILAIEPEPVNFAQMRGNIEMNNFSTINPVQKGVWSRTALLEHDTNFCPAKDWAFSVRETEYKTGDIEVDTLNNLMRSNGVDRVDYLKMDIEGAEFELFKNPSTWANALKHLKVISIEIHEKKGDRKIIEDYLESNGFKISFHGELLVGWRVHP